MEGRTTYRGTNTVRSRGLRDRMLRVTTLLLHKMDNQMGED